MSDAHLARFLLDRCNGLIANRSRYTSKEDFAHSVLQLIFADSSLDLLLLRPHFDSAHADALNRLNALIGFESTVFMTIYVNDALFDEFIELFSQHCIRSAATTKEATESVYMWLLAEYLNYILPIDEQRLNLLKNSNWLSGPLSSTLPTSTVTSPRRLLRSEVLAQSAPLEHISLRTGAFKTLYPRLLQFVGTLLNHVASLSSWPSIAQFQVLRVTLNHYISFLLSDAEDSDFDSLKLLLLRKPLFVELLQNFLERLMRNWPLDESYCMLVEIWRTLIYHRSLERCHDEKYRLFLQAFSQYYVGLIELQIRRMLDSNCKQLLESPVLNFVKDNVFRCEQILSIFAQNQLPTIDYLRALLLKLVDFKADIQRNLNTVHQNRNKSLWMWLFRLIFSLSYTEPVNMHLLDSQIRELQELIALHSKKPTWREFDSSQNRSFASTSEMMSRTANFSTLNPEIPDHAIDPWTKMLFLTPQGRHQVLNRQAKFDYAKYSSQISDAFPSIGCWDIRPLAKFLHQLSIRWTDTWLVRYLRQHGRDSIISRYASRALLSGPSPPRYVPVFARYVPQRPARLKLYKFADISNILYALFCILLFAAFFKFLL